MSVAKSSAKSAGPPKKLNPYQEHMKKTLKELKAAAARTNKPYNHKDAFKAAAASWSARAK